MRFERTDSRAVVTNHKNFDRKTLGLSTTYVLSQKVMEHLAIV